MNTAYEQQDGCLQYSEDLRYLAWTPTSFLAVSPLLTIPLSRITDLRRTVAPNPHVALIIYIGKVRLVFIVTDASDHQGELLLFSTRSSAIWKAQEHPHAGHAHFFSLHANAVPPLPAPVKGAAATTVWTMSDAVSPQQYVFDGVPGIRMLPLSPLLRLPAELRPAIFSEVAASVYEVIINSDGGISLKTASLPSVNRQVRREFLAVCNSPALAPETVVAKISDRGFQALLRFLKQHPPPASAAARVVIVKGGVLVGMPQAPLIKLMWVEWLTACKDSPALRDGHNPISHCLIHGCRHVVRYHFEETYDHHDTDDCIESIRNALVPLWVNARSMHNLLASLALAHDKCITDQAAGEEAVLRNSTMMMRFDPGAIVRDYLGVALLDTALQRLGWEDGERVARSRRFLTTWVSTWRHHGSESRRAELARLQEDLRQKKEAEEVARKVLQQAKAAAAIQEGLRRQREAIEDEKWLQSARGKAEHGQDANEHAPSQNSAEVLANISSTALQDDAPKSATSDWDAIGASARVWRPGSIKWPFEVK